MYKFFIVIVISLFLPLSVCSAKQPSPGERHAAHRQIAILSHGYAMLYNKAQELAKIHDLLRVKIQSKDTAQIIDAISNYGQTLSKQLKSLVKRYPALSLKHTGLPLIEKKKRTALSHYYLKTMAPLVGRSGKDFDRTLLETQREELNQVRFYASAIASEERDPNRKKLMQQVRQRTNKLYNRLFNLLKSKYYTH